MVFSCADHIAKVKAIEKQKKSNFNWHNKKHSRPKQKARPETISLWYCITKRKLNKTIGSALILANISWFLADFFPTFWKFLGVLRDFQIVNALRRCFFITFPKFQVAELQNQFQALLVYFATQKTATKKGQSNYGKNILPFTRLHFMLYIFYCYLLNIIMAKPQSCVHKSCPYYQARPSSAIRQFGSFLFIFKSVQEASVCLN